MQGLPVLSGTNVKCKVYLCYLGQTLNVRVYQCHLGQTFDARGYLCHLGQTFDARGYLCHLGQTFDARGYLSSGTKSNFLESRQAGRSFRTSYGRKLLGVGGNSNRQ